MVTIGHTDYPFGLLSSEALTKGLLCISALKSLFILATVGDLRVVM